MLLLVVSYSKPQAEVLPHVDSHKSWVIKYFNAGLFLAAGPKKDKSGGVIFAKFIKEDKLQEILAEDSFGSEKCG